jgi:type II secretory pathway pseudopilin PulG
VFFFSESPHPHRPVRHRGFTLVEALVVIALVLATLGLLAGPISRSRQNARQAVTASNMRSLAIMQFAHADQHKGEFATIFSPQYRNVASGLEVVEVRGLSLRGGWFENALWSWLVAAPDATAGVLLAPGNPRRNTNEAEPRADTDYALTNTLFATPEYWDKRTQRGPEQWRSQRADSFAFPSDKGFLIQMLTYEVPEYPAGHMACCFKDYRTGLVWADLSATREAIGAMPLGVPNPWHHTRQRGMPAWATGAPVIETFRGVAGRDRGVATSPTPTPTP